MQVAISKLYEDALSKNNIDLVTNTTYLYQTLQTILQTSADQIDDVLQTDKLFFDYFNPFDCYSLESIYYDIPRLNNIIATEWDSLENMDIPNFRSINGRNSTNTFSEQITKMLSQTKNVTRCSDETVCNAQNLQKKITPWKTLLQDQELSKQIGDLILIASLVDKPANLGGLARTCEVFGVSRLILNDAKIKNNKEFKSLSMSSEDWLDITEVKVGELQEFLLGMKQKGYSVIGAEQTSESSKLGDCKFSRKSVLLLGYVLARLKLLLLFIIKYCHKEVNN